MITVGSEPNRSNSLDVDPHDDTRASGGALATSCDTPGLAFDGRRRWPRRAQRRRSPLLFSGSAAAAVALLLVGCAAVLPAPARAANDWLNLPDDITRVPDAQPTPKPDPTPEENRTPDEDPISDQDPTPIPKPTPTPEPTKKPTLKPTRKPEPEPTETPKPTRSPTRPPTEKLTPVPSPEPTEQPTPEPTRKPTRKPTPEPTRKPTRIPTLSPTHEPTPNPTRKPSDGPTPPPTPDPTARPTREPTTEPTPQPSREPTDGPTREPTPRPTKRPTPRPTDGPTVSPTISQMPTRSPTVSPSASPTPSPSAQPSQSPSHAPSPSPSASPSAPPSLAEQEYVVEIVAEFDEVQREFTGSSQILLEEVTEKLVRTAVIVATQEAGAELLNYRVRANFKRQARREPPPETKKTASGVGGSGGRALRLLQQVDNALLVTMDIYASFKSTTLFDQEGMNELVGGAFNSDEDRAQYIKELKATGDSAFSSINSVLVTINGIPQVEPDQIQRQVDQGTNTWLIWGPVIGGVCLVLVIFGIIFRRHNAAKNVAASHSPTLPDSDGRVSTMIEVEQTPDEVSTLGDPVYTGGAMFTGSVEKDETVAAESSADYDYARFYGSKTDGPSVTTGSATKTAQGQSASELEGDNSQVTSGRYTLSSGSNVTDTVIGKLEAPSLFSDDASFERQYSELEDRIEVIAPAGKLGVVIDTPHGGVPVVHAIKDTSVLATKIKVGDRLIYVDDEDVTRFSAIEVSRLISRKAQQPERHLIFVRYRSTEE